MATQNPIITPSDLARFSRAAPFWLSLGLIPLAWFCAFQGGWTIALLPLVTWFMFSLLDEIVGLNFENADLYWGSFVTAHLDGANFENANLQGAILKEASCVGTNFQGANLGRDNLGGSSQLQGADLTAAILKGAKLEGAEYDGKTLFPCGFDPKSHGMIERKA